MWAIALVSAVGIIACCFAIGYILKNEKQTERMVLIISIIICAVSILIFASAAIWSIYTLIYPISRGTYITKSSSSDNNLRIIRTKKCNDYALIPDSCHLIRIEKIPYTVTFGESEVEIIEEQK